MRSFIIVCLFVGPTLVFPQSDIELILEGKAAGSLAIATLSDNLDGITCDYVNIPSAPTLIKKAQRILKVDTVVDDGQNYFIRGKAAGSLTIATLSKNIEGISCDYVDMPSASALTKIAQCILEL